MNTEQHREPWEALTLFGAMPVVTYLAFDGALKCTTWLFETLQLYYYIL